MKQLLQSLKNGEAEVADVPSPRLRDGHLLIETTRSVVSAGTERMLVEFGKGSLVSKAQQQPDKVRDVLNKVRTDGVNVTIDAVRSKLDQPIPLGYCNVGRVLEVSNVGDKYKAGDRVVSNGCHAEVVTAPYNLCAKIPDEVSDERAVFTVLAAIGLQGIRLAKPTLGECFVVTGLGLIGLLTVQMLRAHGCKVLGIDHDQSRLKLAKLFGAEIVDLSAGEDPLSAAQLFSENRGVDAVIITASTTSNEPLSQAAKMSRKRGRIVLVGTAGLEINRADFYEKELSFQVSCSYGPGRYDPQYEDHGNDYPIGFVRWTQQRNFEAVLDLMKHGLLNIDPLISHVFDIDDGPKALELLASKEKSLGIVLRYKGSEVGANPKLSRTVSLKKPFAEGQGNVAFIGAGNYAGRVLIPAFKSAGANLNTLVSNGGVSSTYFGKKFGFEKSSTDLQEVLDNPEIDTVVIATRHDAHAKQILASLKSGKHVFCEKPLCITFDELEEIEAEIRSRPGQRLMVGFNRRFAPHVQKAKTFLSDIKTPKNFIMTVNAGEIPSDHWTQNPEVGGGRIIGEGCHFIDLMRFLADAPVLEAKAICLGEHPTLKVRDDKVVITLQFADGSVGVINYLANGHRAIAKERLEIFANGSVLQLNNFLTLRINTGLISKKNRLWKQNKGQNECVSHFLKAIRSGSPTPIMLDEIIESSYLSIKLAKELS